MSGLPLNTSTHWIGLNTLTQPSLETQAPVESHSDTLPVVVDHSPLFRELKSNSKQRLPYTHQLNSSVEAIKTFIVQHAQNSPSKAQALKNLELYALNRVNCSGSDLKTITLNSHRTNLNVFVEALHNPSIDHDKKLMAALELSKGLGVCPEGENLNIYEQSTALHSGQNGLTNKILTAKNTLIDQQLLQLVRHEAALFMPPRQAQALEIHQVQALKNHLATQWGLPSVADKHASATYQQQAGKMAEVLLEKTVTPTAVARLVAQHLHSTITTNRQGIEQGIDANTLDYDGLKQLVELEYGNDIPLADCLDTSDDYSTVTVKSEDELTELVLNAFKALCLIDKNADVTALAQKDAPPQFHELLPSLEEHRDMRAVHHTWTPPKVAARQLMALAHLSSSFGLSQKTQQDDEKKRRENQARHSSRG